LNDLGNVVDKASSPGTLVAATFGSITNVQAAAFSASTDQNPGLAATTGTLKFTFTTTTALASGANAIGLEMNSIYLSEVGAFTSTVGSATGPSGTCQKFDTAATCAQSASVATCGVSTAAKSAQQTILCSFTGKLDAGVVSLSLTAGTYKVGSSQPASSYKVTIGSTGGSGGGGFAAVDTSSATATLPALAAGAVTAVQPAVFSVDGDKVPGTTSTGTLTFGFTTATDLASGAKVLVTLPVGYLASATSAKLGGTAINCLLSVSQSCTTQNQLLTCTTTAAASKGAQSLVLQIAGFMVGSKNAAAGTSYTVATASSNNAIIDTAGSSTVPALTAGTASGSGTATASVPATDMIPGTTTTGTLTLAFSTSTAVPMTNGKITFSLPHGYLASASNAVLTGGSTTSTCTTALIAGSAATGCSAAVNDRIVCTVGTANLAAGSYNFVLQAGGWTVGAAQSAGTFSVSTSNNGVALDVASATGSLPKIGGTVAVTSFAAATATDLGKVLVASTGAFSIGFTTTSNLATSSIIQFKLPIQNYFSALNGATMTGQDTTAPTCSVAGSVLSCKINSALKAGASIIVLTAGWIPGLAVSAAQFQPMANSNKATYTISNLKTPAAYLAAGAYPTDYKATFGAGPNECSAAVTFPQFGALPGPSTPTTPASSGKELVLSALLALSYCVALFLF